MGLGTPGSTLLGPDFCQVPQQKFPVTRNCKPALRASCLASKSFFITQKSLGVSACFGIQVSRELRLLAENHGVKICKVSLKPRRMFFFQTQKRMLHPVLWHDTVHTFSYDRRIPAFLNCSRDINGLAGSISLYPQLCCWLHMQLTFLPCCNCILKTYWAHGPQTLRTDCMWPRIHGQVHSVCNSKNRWGGRWGVSQWNILYAQTEILQDCMTTLRCKVFPRVKETYDHR